MYNVTITITFLDYWHCGSGQSGGNESDALVVKYDKGTKKGLPYVPARTLKGLMREMAEANRAIDCASLQKWFGNTADTKNKCYQKDEIPNDETITHLGNADIKEAIKEENIPFLFKIFKSTRLENSIAKDKTLREIEAVVPLTLCAAFTGIEADPSQLEHLENAIKSIKRIGLNRNRGMGRCEVTTEAKEATA